MTETVKKIREEMKEQGLTQRQLSERAGVTEASISRWMNGTREPSIVGIEKMCKALGLTICLFH